MTGSKAWQGWNKPLENFWELGSDSEVVVSINTKGRFSPRSLEGKIGFMLRLSHLPLVLLYVSPPPGWNWPPLLLLPPPHFCCTAPSPEMQGWILLEVQHLVKYTELTAGPGSSVFSGPQHWSVNIMEWGQDGALQEYSPLSPGHCQPPSSGGAYGAPWCPTGMTQIFSLLTSHCTQIYWTPSARIGA